MKRDKHTMVHYLVPVLLVFVLVGCGSPPKPTPDAVATQVAQQLAVAATLTASAPTETPTNEPTASPAELDAAFLNALTVGCRAAIDERRQVEARIPPADAAAICAAIDDYTRAMTTESACYQMLPEPTNPTLMEAHQWLRTSGQKWVEALTLIGYFCAGLEDWTSVSPILREAGAAGDKANGLLDLYFTQHPEDKPSDWVY